MKVFDIKIDPLDYDTGLNAISLVENPAVETDFLIFSKEEKKQLQFADDEKHIISGVALLADTPIYRVAPDGTEYYVNFSKEVIEQLVERYFSHNLTNSVDINHDGNLVEGVVMTESFLINHDRGICPKEFSDLSDGSWITSFKVLNDEVWSKVKSGEVKGFSVSGLFSMIDSKFASQDKKDDDEEECIELLNKIKEKLKMK